MKLMKHAHSSLFLMEMMVVILFFSLTSAICVHLFAQSYQTAKHSEELTNSVLQAESAAELYKSAAGDLQQTADLLAAQWEEDKGLLASYDASWQIVQQDGAYLLTMTEVQRGPVPTAEIIVSALDGREIYRLTVKAYQPGGDRL